MLPKAFGFDRLTRGHCSSFSIDSAFEALILTV